MDGGIGGGGGGGGIHRRPVQQTMQRPLQGLQAARPGAGAGMYGAQQAGQAALRNQSVQNRMQPFVNPMGGMTYATGPAPQPTGYDQNGRASYGWGPDGPIYNPQVDYVQLPPGGPVIQSGGMPVPSNGGGGQPPLPPGGQVGPFDRLPRIPEMESVDDSQAAREAYARAKDVAGSHGRAALDALMDIQGGRGIVGSGIGVNEAGGVIAEGARQLGDFNREQAIQRVENERRRREINYQGNISQRGQDYGGRGTELQRLIWNAGRSPAGSWQTPSI
jgi:hypothetical protein